MGSELVPTPAEVMAKATKMLQRVMLLQVVWFACFMAGGLLTIWTAWKNTHLPAACTAHLVPSATSGSDRGLWPSLIPLAGALGPGRDRRAVRHGVRGDASRGQVPRRRGGGLLAERTPLRGTDGPACGRPGHGRPGHGRPGHGRGVPGLDRRHSAWPWSRPSTRHAGAAVGSPAWVTAVRTAVAVGCFNEGRGSSAPRGSARRPVRRSCGHRRPASRDARRTPAHEHCRPAPTTRPVNTRLGRGARERKP